MKYTFDENKINIFTLVNDKVLEEEPWWFQASKKSWELIPNAVIHYFTDKDLEDTFPEVLKNDPWWDRLSELKDMVNSEGKHIVRWYHTAYMNKRMTQGSVMYNNFDFWGKEVKRHPASTDIVRIKLLKEIPNALYLDSDCIITDVDTLVDKIENYGNWQFNPANFTGFWHKKGASTETIDFLIEKYHEVANKFQDGFFVDSHIIPWIFTVYPEKALMAPDLFYKVSVPYYHICVLKSRPIVNNSYINKIKIYVTYDTTLMNLPHYQRANLTKELNDRVLKDCSKGYSVLVLINKPELKHAMLTLPSDVNSCECLYADQINNNIQVLECIKFLWEYIPNKDKIEAIINVSGTVTETVNHTLNITYDFRNINKDYADKLIEIAKKKGIMDFNTLYTESNLQP